MAGVAGKENREREKKNEKKKAIVSICSREKERNVSSGGSHVESVSRPKPPSRPPIFRKRGNTHPFLLLLLLDFCRHVGPHDSKVVGGKDGNPVLRSFIHTLVGRKWLESGRSSLTRLPATVLPKDGLDR
ncbi:hypothetical protein AVEN_150783-1 [Araneus ventricosus]|uniref:Uncharacterized protein n=1 Tax=Araneus ventricosus TaxID=182803 RepID=A0A4Y2G8J6_ARAVE|nr:hypothetical protein AVEN_150783-1 [Araneus ventricosus]